MTVGRTFVGVDVGGTKVLACAVATDDGDAVTWSGRATPPAITGDGLLDLIADVVDEVSGGDRPAAVGVGYPGLVDPAGGVHSSVILPTVGGIALAAVLSARLGVPCGVDNDVNVAAVAEARHRPEDPDFIYVRAGTGIGGALVLDGQVRRGRRGLAGEIGHITIRADGAACPCGGRGCLHLDAGGRVIEAALEVPPGGLADVDLDRRAGAWSAVEDAGWALGVGLANAVAVVDVDLVVVGGGLLSLGPRYLRAVRSGFDATAMTELGQTCRIEPARAGAAAGAEGALVLARGADLTRSASPGVP